MVRFIEEEFTIREVVDGVQSQGGDQILREGVHLGWKQKKNIKEEYMPVLQEC